MARPRRGITAVEAEILATLARAYCSGENSNKQMDATLLAEMCELLYTSDRLEIELVEDESTR